MRAGALRATAAVAGILLSTAFVAPARADQVRDAQWHLGYLRMAEANRIADGDGITVAVLDSGVDAGQPDLAGAVLRGIDGWTTAKDGRTDTEPDRHGTAVAATIAGRGHGAGGADGIRGIAPKANILPIGVWPPGTTELRGDNVAYGIRWAVDSGAHVICIAGGGSGESGVSDALEYAVGKGVPVVAAIGNTPRPRAAYPGWDPDVLGVGSVGRDGSHSAFSVSDQEIDVVAPGDQIQGPRAGGGYTAVQGTSYSTAVTAGIVALIRQKHPRLPVKQIYQLLKDTAVDKGPAGFDHQYGWGVVDPMAALTAPPPAPSSIAPTAPAGPDAAVDDPSPGSDTLVALALATLIWGSILAGLILLVVFLVRRRKRRRLPVG